MLQITVFEIFAVKWPFVSPKTKELQQT